MSGVFYAYIRVSTTKQGEYGVSLHEQRDAIESYARGEGLKIKAWFEERETAAKRGRSVFNAMLAKLRAEHSVGVIIHKVDRGARNLKDWSELADLMDAGIEVRVANGGMDLTSRGGRLTADIQAVVAADYIRNLREEILKGLYGRLKQGIYPFAAPIGYLDQGGGKLKIPNPNTAPLIADAFELYASGEYSLIELSDHLFSRGLRSRNGNRVSFFFVSDEQIRACLAKSDEQVARYQDEAATLSSERKKLEAEMEKAYRLYTDDILEPKAFGDLYQPMCDRRDQIDARLIELHTKIDVLKIDQASSEEVVHGARNLYGQWDKLAHEEKRSIIEAITDNIVIGKSEIEINLHFVPTEEGGQKATQHHGFIAATS